MRRIGVMIGSDSDLPQCLEGLLYLAEEERLGNARVMMVWTNSIHRHTVATLHNTDVCHHHGVDVIIAGAGKAAHLPGMVDSWLRYDKKNDKTVVIGVAFDGSTDRARQAAILSIAEVPGTQVVFEDGMVGSDGFLEACRLAVRSELPKIELKKAPPLQFRSLNQAVEAAMEVAAALSKK